MVKRGLVIYVESNMKFIWTMNTPIPIYKPLLTDAKRHERILNMDNYTQDSGMESDTDRTTTTKKLPYL